MITAKNLNPDIRVIARITNPQNGKKLKQAGANEVFLPEIESGKLVAMLLERPNVSKLLLSVLLDESNPFDIEEFVIKPCSPLANLSVGQIFKGNQAGHLIAIKRGETFLIFPAKEEVIRGGDTLIVMGNYELLKKFSKLANC